MVIKKNNSIFVGIFVDEDGAGKGKLVVEPARICSSRFNRTSIESLGSKSRDELKVRALIKNKLAVKNEIKLRTKTHKLINFLREQNSREATKGFLGPFKPSKNLINFLN
jgi:hypothetical protein